MTWPHLPSVPSLLLSGLVGSVRYGSEADISGDSFDAPLVAHY